MEPLENLGHGGYCSSCNTIKPLKEFKRYLTNAEALSRGYAANYRVEVETTLCKSCRPKPRPITKLRAGEIRQRVASGDLDGVVAHSELSKRNVRAQIKRKMSSAAQARARWNVQLKALLKPMSEHIIGVDNWIRYQKKRGTPSDAPSMVFMGDYLALLRKERERIKFNQLMEPAPITNTAWQQYTPYAKRLELWKKWDEMPPDQRRLMLRTPPLLATYKE